MRLRLLCLLLVIGLVSAACGGGDDPDDEAGDDDTADDDTADDDSDDDTESDLSSTTTDSPLSPPTSRGPAPTLTFEPLTGVGGIGVLSGEPAYTGVLGQIDPDRNIVIAVALPPAPAADGIAPLTGLPIADQSAAERPAILVKIDNTEKGRPQEAISQADIVYVEQIEGGFTRLAMVFHTNTPVELGPVRSGRTTDIALLGSLNQPIFVWSGANRVHAALLRRQNIVDLGAGTRTEYSRAADRPGTYDLMTDPTVLWEIAAGRDEGESGGTPSPHFEYRDDTIGLPASAEPASTASIAYPSVTSEWSWDRSAKGWRRTQSGTEHVDADDLAVLAANVVVAEVPHVRTGSTDTAGSAVYEEQFLGSGRGWVFTDGHYVEVTWTKPSIHSVATWTTPDGIPVALVPGQTWIELAPIDSVTIG